MKIRYYLKKRGHGPTHPVFVALYDGDQTELIFTGERLAVKEWNPREMQPRNQTSDAFARIEKVKGKVQKSMKLLEAQDKPVTPYTVKSAYGKAQQDKEQEQKAIDKKEKLGAQSVYSLAKAYKENLPDKFRESTRRTLKISIDQFMQYLDKAGLRGLKIGDMTEDVVSGYAKYLLEKRLLSDASLNKRIKHLKWFFKTTKFTTAIPPRKLKRKGILALTVPELRLLEAVDITTHKDKESHEYLQRAKDMFLLGCYTALRISDLKRLNPANSGGKLITLTTQKNNEVYEMPIMSTVRVILDRYDGHAPKISEQEVNRSIKKVCELANINRLVEVEGTRGGKGFTKSMPFYSLITSHIAGKTFITNAKELWNLDPAEVAGIVRRDFKTMLNHYFKPPVESASAKMIQADKAIMKVAHG